MDEISSDELLLQHQAFLRRLARRLIADEHRAEDVAQDAALLVLERAPRGLRSTRAWLARVVRNLAINAARGERRRVAREQSVRPPDPPRTPEEVAESLQLQRRVVEAVERLDEPYRSVVYLRYHADLGPKEIAERLGIPVSTVKTRLDRGLARLRFALDDAHGGRRHWWVVGLAGELGRRGRPWTWAEIGRLAGGLAMGSKGIVAALALVTVALAGAWWSLRPAPEGPAAAEPGALAGIEPAHEASAAPSLAPPEARRERVAEAVPAPAVEPSAAASAAPETTGPGLLTVRLRGWDPEDQGPVSLRVSDSASGEPRLSVERPAAAAIDLDASAFFRNPGDSPAQLLVRADHPRYLPAETWVLVPSDTDASVPDHLTATVDLVPPKGFVGGEVVVPEGIAPETVRVAIHAMDKGRPASEPVDVTHCGPDARYRLRADSSAEHVVVAHVEPGGRGARLCFRPATHRVVIEQGTELELESLLIDEGAVLSGQVSVPGVALLPEGRISAQPVDPGTYVGGPLLWVEGRFESALASAALDTDGRFRLTGLAPLPYRLTPRVRLEGRDRPTIELADSDTYSIPEPHEVPAFEVSAPAFDVALVMQRVRVPIQVLGDGLPVAGASVSALRYEGGSGVSWSGTRTDLDGRVDVITDPSRPLTLRARDLRHAPARLDLEPGGFGPDQLIEVDLGSEREPAALVLHVAPGGAEIPDDALVDFIVLALDEMDPDEIDMYLASTSSFAGLHSNVAIMPGECERPRLASAPAGDYVLEGMPAGRCLVRVLPRIASNERAFMVLSEELEVSSSPGERTERTWTPRLGGCVRLNFTGAAERVRAAVLDAAGEPLTLSYTRGGSSSSMPFIPGVSEVRPALPPGPYRLEIHLPDGRRALKAFQVEPGRVTDVEVDLAAL